MVLDNTLIHVTMRGYVVRGGPEGLRMERRIIEQEAEDEEATIAQHDLLNSEIEPIAFSPRITSQ